MTRRSDGVTPPDGPGIPGLALRHYRGPGDLPAIVEILHAGHAADGVQWLPSLDDVRNEFENLVNEAMLGTDHGWLERISTRRRWRGRGVAKAMIASAMWALRERGMSHAALGVDTENPSGAFALYENLGFRTAHRMEVLARRFDEQAVATD